MRTLWLAAAALVTGIGLLIGSLLAPRDARLPPLEGFTAVPYLAAGPHHFGDAVEAALDVGIAAGAADPDSVRARLTVFPFRVLDQRVTRYADGDDRLVRFRFHITCLEAVCVPGEGNGDLLLPDTLVRYRDSSGRERSLLVGWPALVVEPRAAKADSTRWEAGLSSLPPVETSVAPRVAAVTLALAAVFVFLTALLVLQPWLEAAWLWVRRDRRSAVARALEQVRHAAQRPDVPERRRALDLLARVLRAGRRDGESGAAAELAWSRPAPTPSSMDELAERVELS